MLLEKEKNVLRQIDYWISIQKTGRPNFFAQRLNLSPSTLYQKINYLKDLGGSIDYCRKRQTYYYKQPCELVFEIYFRKK